MLLGFETAGIFVALALRFDMQRGRDKTYFTSAFAGYTAGLLVTILVMNWFQAAQVFPFDQLNNPLENLFYMWMMPIQCLLC